MTIALTIVGVLVVAVGVLTAVIFGGRGSKDGAKNSLLTEQRYALLECVPTDAIALVVPSDLSDAAKLYSDQTSLSYGPLAGASEPKLRKFFELTESLAAERQIQSLKGAKAVVSFHYTGDLQPLVVIDDPKGADSLSVDAARLISMADSLGLHSFWTRSRIFVSPSDIVLQSGIRHFQSNECVADAPGFAWAASSVSGGTIVMVCTENCGKIFSEIVAKPYLKYADFFKTLGSWAGFSLSSDSSERSTLSGYTNCSDGVHQYLKALAGASGASSTVAEALPKGKTMWVFSLPSSDMSSYIKGYQSYADSRIGISKFLARQKALGDAAGLSPKAWFGELKVGEAAVAGVEIGGSEEQFILLKVTTPDALCKEGVNEFTRKGFTASLLGGIYSIPNESCCTFKDGWLYIGSQNGISALVQTNILENKLSLEAHEDALAGKGQVALFYYPLSGNCAKLREIFSKEFEAGLEAASYGNPESFLLSIGKDAKITLDLSKPKPAPSKKASAEESSIDIPSGPFKVKNSGTGKEDLLSCGNGRLSLSEEGAELWAVPFDGALCGRASCIDNFANGKLQFLFCSGERLYLYDRLGRPVEGFPVSLGKRVLLGPDVYDFSGARKYNILVLNEDNSIDMYNLKGQKPASWKGISSEERFLGLPEKLDKGGKTYWIVRTATRTLAYPFYGGEPAAEYDGNIEKEQISF